jgi:hypothetical protein
LLILGDLTDAKDGHSSELVNRIVASINSLDCADIKIITGNHDWLKQGQEYFRFLNLLPKVRFITRPEEDQDHEGPTVLYLPYSKNPSKAWQGLSFDLMDYVFMHQTMSGAIASNGNAMEGEEIPDLGKAGRVYSGDIHVPQRLGPLTYVGSPYHVHFGDSFKPRCLLLDRKGNEVDLHFETIKRVAVKVKSLRELKRLDFKAKDQVKVRFELEEADTHGWSRIRRESLAYLTDLGVEVHGIELTVLRSNRRVLVGADKAHPVLTPQEAVWSFVNREELGGSALDAALDVMDVRK